MVDLVASELEEFSIRTEPGREALTAVLAAPGDALLAVDFDGTLAPIIDHPENAEIHPEAAEALNRLGSLLGTVAIITGRPAQAAVALGRLASLPGLSDMVVLGQYGAERWDASTGEFQIPPPPPHIEQVRTEVGEIIDDLGLRGVRIEDKHRAIGVHTRTADDPGVAFDALKDPVQRVADAHGLHVEPGKAVLEVRPTGQDKGAALAGLIAERDARSVMFAGDDLGDLPAFAEVLRQRRAGLPGLLLASASDEQSALLEYADVVVHGPPAVARWLNAVADAIERRG